MTMTSAVVSARVRDGGVSDPEVAARPKRRQFTAEYKKAIVAEYDALPAQSPDRGALLRREGLYTSHLAEWRNVFARGETVGAGDARRKAGRRSSVEKDLVRANEKIAKLEAELARTRTALEIAGKAHALLEMLSESAACGPKSTK
jgi:transposase-like protein